MSFLKALNPLNWVEGIVKVAAEPVKEWQRRKTLEASNQFELDKLIYQAKIKAAERGELQDFDLDKIAMQNMEKSWKDELILIIFLAPVVLAFLGYTEIVEKGFAAIEKMPDWYMWLLVGMIVVIYGMRGLLAKFATNKIKGL